MAKRISVIGLGWLGLPLALELKKKGHLVNGTYSNPQKKERCLELPIPTERICFTKNGIEGNWEKILEQSDILMINIPPKRNSNGVIDYVEYIQHIVKQTPAYKSIIFVSSTSVYGQIDSKITEEIQPQPSTLSGQALLSSEQALKHHFHKNITILRCSGLIGPKRHPGRFLAGKKDIANAQGLVNILHQKDCIEIITKVIEQSLFGYTFNLCSDEHPTRQEFYTKATRLLQLELPVFNPNSIQSNKYIDNTLSKRILNHQYLTIEKALFMC